MIIFKQVILILIISANLLSCNKPVKNYPVFLKVKSVRSNQISIIFKNVPSISNTFKPHDKLTVTTIVPAVMYFDGYYENEIPIKKTIDDQEFNFSSKGKYIVLKHRYDAFNSYEFILEKGDSAIVKYISGKPKLTILNRKSKFADLTFDELIRKRFYKQSHSPIFKYLEADFFTDWLLKDPQQHKLEIRKAAFIDAKDLLAKENLLLDSLKSKNLISPTPYEFYKSRAYMLSLILDLKETKQPDQNLAFYTSKLDSAKFYPNIYNRQFIEAIADKYIIEKAKYLDIRDGINRDYRETYSAIKSNSFFSKYDRNWLLTRDINRIAKTFSQQDFKKFFSFYSNDVNDTVLINKVKNQNSLKFNDNINATTSLNLVSIDSKPLTFDELKRRHAGKIIYVDFWASWCAPCRKAMPHSLKLREELKKDIVFVYLSIDKTIKPWRSASAAEKIDGFKENYLIVNYQNSDFIEQQKVHEIPRYMIFDKKGKLAYAKAPMVESRDLKPLLIELAKK